MRKRLNEGQIIRKAVSGMLPKNTFRQRRLDRLKVFPAAAPDAYLQNVVRTWRDRSSPTTATSTLKTVEGVQAEVGGR